MTTVRDDQSHSPTPCMLRSTHQAHTWWYTSEGGGHMLDPEIAEQEVREGRESKGLKKWWCEGLTVDLPAPEQPTQSQPDPFPNITLLSKGADERTTIADFLEWCHQQGYHLGEYRGLTSPNDTMAPLSRSDDSVAMAYLGIDEQALERERRSILDALRLAQP